MAKPTSKKESSALSERKWCNLYCNTVATRNLKRFYKNQMNRAKRRESHDDHLYKTKEEKWEIKTDCVTQDNFDYDKDDEIDKWFEEEWAWIHYESGIQDLRENKILIDVYKF